MRAPRCWPRWSPPAIRFRSSPRIPRRWKRFISRVCGGGHESRTATQSLAGSLALPSGADRGAAASGFRRRFGGAVWAHDHPPRGAGAVLVLRRAVGHAQRRAVGGGGNPRAHLGQPEAVVHRALDHGVGQAVRRHRRQLVWRAGLLAFHSLAGLARRWRGRGPALWRDPAQPGCVRPKRGAAVQPGADPPPDRLLAAGYLSLPSGGRWRGICLLLATGFDYRYRPHQFRLRHTQRHADPDLVGSWLRAGHLLSGVAAAVSGLGADRLLAEDAVGTALRLWTLCLARLSGLCS